MDLSDTLLYMYLSKAISEELQYKHLHKACEAVTFNLFHLPDLGGNKASK